MLVRLCPAWSASHGSVRLSPVGFTGITQTSSHSLVERLLLVHIADSTTTVGEKELALLCRLVLPIFSEYYLATRDFQPLLATA